MGQSIIKSVSWPIPLGFLAVSSFAPTQSYRMFIIQDSTITKNRILKRRGVKVFKFDISYRVPTSKFEKGGVKPKDNRFIDQKQKFCFQEEQE
jgi:hypothetical protein